MKKLMMTLVAACAAVAARAYTSESYVQDGLIAQWDGIDNLLVGGVRQHDANAAVWSDLTGNGNDFAVGDYWGTQLDSWTDTSLKAKSCYSVPCAKSCSDYVTIEICAKHNQQYQCLFNSGDGLKKFVAVKNNSIQFYNATSKNYDIGKAAFFQAAAVHFPDVSSPVVYTNGVATTQTSSDTWSNNSTGTCLGRGANNYQFTGEYYAIRLYNRALTPEELARNARIDAVRFLGGGGPDMLMVSGRPSDYGEVSPAYGTHSGYSAGQSETCTAPAVWTNDDGKMRAVCDGYKVLAEDDVVARGDGNSFTYVHPDCGSGADLVWQWKIQHLVAPTASSGLTVSPASAWVGDGEDMTFAVSGAAHPVWTVDGVTQPGHSASITIKVSAPHAVSVVDARLIYVTQEGMGQKDGSSWGNAFGSIQAAIDDAGTYPAIIYLLQGDYPLTAELAIAEGADLAFVGGCTGAGSEIGTEKSVLIRDTEVDTTRLLIATAATASFSDIVFSGGRLTAANSYGHGVYGNDAVLSFTRCAFNDNGVTTGATAGHYGGAFAATGGSATFNDCVFTKNRLVMNQDGVRGGAVWAQNVALEFAGCLFATNYVEALNWGSRGGAIYASGGSTLVTNCVFNGDYTTHSRGYESWSGRKAIGGAICLETVPSATIVDSAFDGCYVNDNLDGNPNYAGGTIYLSGAGCKTEIVRCVVRRGGVSGFTTNTSTDNGSICLVSGTASIVNALFVGAHAHAIEVAGGAFAIRNVTAVGGDCEPILQKDGAVTVVNSVIWGNTPIAAAGAVDLRGGTIDVTYSDIQGGYAGVGNFETDPLFADLTYCHPKSRAGHYAGGWFAGGTWVVDDVDSPVIDAAPASDAVGDEPQPNGHRLNIGYDAGLPVASKTYLGEPAVPTALAMYIHPLVEPGEDAFTVEGEFGLAANGSATVTAYWGETDGGTVAANWDNAEEIGVFPDWTVVSKRLTDLEGRTFVRLKADDGESAAWSAARTFAPVKKATLSDVSITHLMRNTLRANGTLAEDGGAPTSVRFRYWTDEESEAVIVDYNYGNPIAVGESFSIDIAGLESGVTYHYAVEAVNSAGEKGEIQEVTTLSTDPITVYVTTTGAGVRDGSSWANAFGSLQDALDACYCAGDVIQLGSGEHTVGQAHDVNELSHYFTFDAAGLTINGDPNGGTVLLAPSATPVRVFHAKSATIAFNDVTFRRGRLEPANSYGHGVYGESSALVFNRCTFDDNGCPSGALASVHRGGGFAADGGSAVFVDCVFTKNVIYFNEGADSQHGAGIWTKNAALEVVSCLFATNVVNGVNCGARGGAIYATGGSVLVTNCTFNGNCVTHEPRGYASWSSRKAAGGAIFFAAVPAVTIVDSTFDGNYSNDKLDGVSCYAGGAIYLTGAKGVAMIERCKVLRGGISGFTTNTDTDNGSICIESGTAAVVNCLVTGMHSNAFEVAGGTMAITNVTVVGGDREPVLQKGGTVTVVNSILWDNESETGVSFDVAGGTTEVSHSDVAGGFEGEGNIDKDPLLYGPTKKRAYRLRAGSPCAGKGDATGWTAADTDLDGLKRLRNGKVDLGCYSFNAPGLMLMLK